MAATAAAIGMFSSINVPSHANIGESSRGLLLALLNDGPWDACSAALGFHIGKTTSWGKLVEHFMFSVGWRYRQAAGHHDYVVTRSILGRKMNVRQQVFGSSRRDCALTDNILLSAQGNLK